MKFTRIAVLFAAGLLIASAAFAEGGKGEGLYGLQITNGTADLYSPSGNYNPAYDHSEMGLGFQYWRLMSSDYAFTMSAGVGFFSETDKPISSAPSGTTDFKYTQSSFNVRVGGDRAVKVGDRAIFYFGPGLEYWSGKAKFEGGSFTTAFETKNVTRIGLSGRVGGVMMLSKTVGFNCQVGRYVAMASASDAGGKTNWWPSGFQASGGLVFRGK